MSKTRLRGPRAPSLPATRVLIGIPSRDEWMAEFGMNLVLMTNYEASRGSSLAVWNTRGSMLFNMREELADRAIEMKATHLLFLDTDMTFPENVLERLLAWGKDLVACACVTKKFPPTPTAFLGPGKPLYLRHQGMLPLMPIWRVGTGVMLISVRALKALPKPRFPIRYREEIGHSQGEDWGFVEKLESIGVQAHIDTALSWEIGHLGVVPYSHHHVEYSHAQQISCPASVDGDGLDTGGAEEAQDEGKEPAFNGTGDGLPHGG